MEERSSTTPSEDDSKRDLEKQSISPAESSEKDQPPQTRTAQDWEGPNDPENPLNWSLRRKIYHTASIGLLCFAATFGTSVYTPGVPSVVERFHVSTTAAYLPLSLNTIGLGFGPAVGAPISENFGRRAVYWFAFPLSLLFAMGSGLAQNFGTLLVCRFFVGFFASPALAVGAGSNNDMWQPIDRATSASFFLLAPFGGPALGPVVGGFCAQRWDWRWTQWPIIMVGGAAYLSTLFQKETYKKIILQKRAKRLNIEPPPSNLPASGVERLKFVYMVTIGRPLFMLCTDTIVGLFSLYVAFNFSVLFGFFASFPVVFQGVYGFDLGQIGLSFLGIGLGITLGAGTYLAFDFFTYRKRTLALRAKGDMSQLPPEQRLLAAMLGSLLLPIGLFWFGWTARASVHWIVPIIATIFFGAGNLLVFCSCVLYLMDAYGPLLGASALAANGVARYVAAAAFPLFTRQMYHRLGIHWATSLFGFITVGLLPIPWLFYRFGPAIRSKSQYKGPGQPPGGK